MSEKTVFLVYGYDNYEYPYDPIKAFASEVDARKLLAVITEYQASRPAMPGDECSDDEETSWWEQDTAWRNAHPAGQAYGHDGFDVMPLPFQGVHP